MQAPPRATPTLRCLFVLFVGSLSVAAACGGGGGGGSGGTSASSSASSGSATSAASVSSGSTSSTGTTTSTGTTSSSSSGAGGGFDFGSCTTKMGVESCFQDSGNGTSVCTEYYSVGQGTLICGKLAKSTPCPRDKDLAAICVGGLSTYFYEDAAHQGTWAGSPAKSGCIGQGGTWCAP